MQSFILVVIGLLGAGLLLGYSRASLRFTRRWTAAAAIVTLVVAIVLYGADELGGLSWLALIFPALALLLILAIALPVGIGLAAGASPGTGVKHAGPPLSRSSCMSS